jgi:hypothetical protein
VKIIESVGFLRANAASDWLERSISQYGVVWWSLLIVFFSNHGLSVLFITTFGQGHVLRILALLNTGPHHEGSRLT